MVKIFLYNKNIKSFTGFLVLLKTNVICLYCSWVLFLRSFFLKENPLFIYIISLVYPMCTLIIPTNTAFDAFIQMRFLLIIGVYLISVDMVGSYISQLIISKKKPYINDFFQDHKNNFYLTAGWSAVIIGKTPMTATGRAAIFAGLVSGGVFLYNGHLQRAHETMQASQQRAHETTQASQQQAHETMQATRQRAYQNYTYARDQYDNKFVKRGPKPTWSEENYTDWCNPK